MDLAKGDAFEVFDVIPGGPADHAGLKVGDVILAVNRKSTAQLALTDVRDQWKNGDPGTEIKLQIQNAAGQEARSHPQASRSGMKRLQA